MAPSRKRDLCAKLAVAVLLDEHREVAPDQRSTTGQKISSTSRMGVRV